MMRILVDELCSARCAGRGAGTPGGKRARGLIANEFVTAKFEPELQDVPGSGGTNMFARAAGSIDRWVLVGAHYDHLGVEAGTVYPGADDNAAGVVILTTLAHALARTPPRGRGVLLAAFDAEEPPHFLTEKMGSEFFAAHPTVPFESIDFMICLDLVGHALGPVGFPDDVRQTLFALGAERSEGTPELVDRLARAVPGVVVRRADVETIPPLSDYHAFWKRGVPFLFLTCGRSLRYHTPEDTPQSLDYPKMGAVADWLERFVRESCTRPGPRIRFLREARDDASTLRSMIEITSALTAKWPQAARARTAAETLLTACGRDGRLAENVRAMMEALTQKLEDVLA